MKMISQQEEEKEFSNRKGEDIMESNTWYVKLVSVELLCMFFNMIQLGNSMVIYEVSFEDQFVNKKTRHIMIALIISTINAFALAAALVF